MNFQERLFCIDFVFTFMADVVKHYYKENYKTKTNKSYKEDFLIQNFVINSFKSVSLRSTYHQRL